MTRTYNPGQPVLIEARVTDPISGDLRSPGAVVRCRATDTLMREVAPGEYQATLIPPMPGEYEYEVVAGDAPRTASARGRFFVRE